MDSGDPGNANIEGSPAFYCVFSQCLLGVDKIEKILYTESKDKIMQNKKHTRKIIIQFYCQQAAGFAYSSMLPAAFWL